MAHPCSLIKQLIHSFIQVGNLDCQSKERTKIEAGKEITEITQGWKFGVSEKT
jgi:hypothetical protein